MGVVLPRVADAAEDLDRDVADGGEPTGEPATPGLADSTADNNANYTVDFGLFTPVRLGNLVFEDIANNGVYDAGADSPLAGATVAGHVLECGAQATGGNYAFFTELPDLDDPGFPIAELRETGEAVITKHPGTGGAVTIDTVTAQLLNQQGTKMSDVTVTPPSGTLPSYSIDLPLANLAAGQYLLEITANSEGHKPVSELVACRVGT